MEVRRTVLHEDEARLEDVRTRLNELTLAVDRHQGAQRLLQGADRGDRGPRRRGARARRPTSRRASARWPSTSPPGRTKRRGCAWSWRRRETRPAPRRRRCSEVAARAGRARRRSWSRPARRRSTVLARMAALQNARESVAGSAERARRRPPEAGRGDGGAGARAGRAWTSCATARERRRRRGRGARSRALAAQRAEAAGRGGRRRARPPSARGARPTRAQSERDGLAGRLSSLEEIVATHSAFDEGVRALLARPDGHRGRWAWWRTRWRPTPQYERAVEALSRRPPAGACSCRTPPTPCAASRGWRSRAPAAAPSCPWPPRARATSARSLRDVARVEPARAGCSCDLFRVTGPHAERHPRARCPTRWWWRRWSRRWTSSSRRGPVSCVTLAGETAARLDGRGRPRGEGPARPAPRDQGGAGAPGGARGARSPSLRQRAQEHAAAAEVATAEARALEERIHGAEKDLVAIRHDLAVAQDERARARPQGAPCSTPSASRRRTSAARPRSGWPRSSRACIGAESRSRAPASERVAGGAGGGGGGARGRRGRPGPLRGGAQPPRRAARARGGRWRRSAGASPATTRSCWPAGAAARARAAEMDARREELRAERAGGRAAAGGGAHRARPRDRRGGRRRGPRARPPQRAGRPRGRPQGAPPRARDAARRAGRAGGAAGAHRGRPRPPRPRVPPGGGHDGRGGGGACSPPEDGALEISGLEVQVQEMRDRLERMGPVNILAVEQAQELEERHTVPDRAAAGPAGLDRRAGPGHQEDRPDLARALPRGLRGDQPALRRDLPPALRRRLRRASPCSTRRTCWRAAST